MPVMNGMDATRYIRDLGYDRPIIAVTGNALAEDQQAFR
jgi:CheY-like chemotaxis protein